MSIPTGNPTIDENTIPPPPPAPVLHIPGAASSGHGDGENAAVCKCHIITVSPDDATEVPMPHDDVKVSC